MSRLLLRPISTAAAQIYAAMRQRALMRRSRAVSRRRRRAPSPPTPATEVKPMDHETAADLIRQAEELERTDRRSELAASFRRLAARADGVRIEPPAPGHLRRRQRPITGGAGGGLDNSLPRGDRDEDREAQLTFGVGALG